MHVNVETQMLLVSERTMSPTGLSFYVLLFSFYGWLATTY